MSILKHAVHTGHTTTQTPDANGDWKIDTCSSVQ